MTKFLRNTNAEKNTMLQDISRASWHKYNNFIYYRLLQDLF